MASRIVKLTRSTRETDITLTLDPDGPVDGGIATSIPFFDHMLTAMSFHGGFGLAVKASGDIDVDAHHLVEDTGLVLGRAWAGVLEKGAVERFAHAVIPMDEALAEVTVDVCGRPTPVLLMPFAQSHAGTFDLSLLREFFIALANEARISLHVEIRRGENGHHMAEAAFKALGKALGGAYAPAKREMSSKGRIG
ncbi:MAG TPA: imidazoleglycerol-phosphate dehydratase [Spirochaetia bacterium]